MLCGVTVGFKAQHSGNSRTMQNADSSTRVSYVASSTRERPYIGNAFHSDCAVEHEIAYHFQGAKPYDDQRAGKYTGNVVCGKSINTIKSENVKEFMRQPTPVGEAEDITGLRRGAYLAGRNTGAFSFKPPAVSQAAACDGVKYTTCTGNQRVIPRPPTTYYKCPNS